MAWHGTFLCPNVCAELHAAVQLEFWGGLKALPWVVKPLYGLMSDAVPLLGYHRRSYLIVLGLIGASLSLLVCHTSRRHGVITCSCHAGSAVWLGFSYVHTTAQAIAALMLVSFSEAFSITVVDSVLVTRTHDQSLDYAAGLQSFCWGLQVPVFEPVAINRCMQVLKGA